MSGMITGMATTNTNLKKEWIYICEMIEQPKNLVGTDTGDETVESDHMSIRGLLHSAAEGADALLGLRRRTVSEYANITMARAHQSGERAEELRIGDEPVNESDKAEQGCCGDQSVCDNTRASKTVGERVFEADVGLEFDERRARRVS